MNITEIEPYLKYVTNAAGEKTEVIIPVRVWELLLNYLKPNDSGLYPIDEQEPKADILADLREALKAPKIDATYPINDLWTDIEN